MKKYIFAKSLVFVFMMSITATYAWGASLTDADVENFISSLKEIQVLGQQYDDLDNLDDEFSPGAEEMKMPENPMSDSLERIRGHEIYGRIQNVVRDHGFTDAEQWANVGDRVFKAYISLDLEGEMPAMRAEMEDALQEIEENPHMSDQQKTQMKQMIENVMSSMEEMTDAPEEDMAVVEGHMDELRQLLEMEM